MAGCLFCLYEEILGISVFYNDSDAAVTIGRGVIATAQEERFKRLKTLRIG